MLFLALPPADMLPPAGHRAGPGRAHTGPITRSGRPGGRPSVSPRAGGAAAARPRLPHKVAQTPPPAPALPRAAGPATGAGDRGRAGTGPKSQCGRNPGLESAGRGGLECPGPQAGPGRVPRAWATIPNSGRKGAPARECSPAWARSPVLGRAHGGGQVGTVFWCRSPSVRVQMRLKPWGPILHKPTRLLTDPQRHHSTGCCPRLKRLPFMQSLHFKNYPV